MKFYVLTLFPEMITYCINTSILGRAITKGIINVDAVNIRDFAGNKHGQVDDYPYGGGAGMVMQPGPIYRSYEYVKNKSGKNPRVIYTTPQGKTFDQQTAEELSKEGDLIFLCGHYEGVDERAIDKIVTDEISIGDYVLTGGELPAMVIMDSISRLIPGVLNNENSAQTESFSNNLLEHPQYTRPEFFLDERVPEVLLSGHHANVDKWRREQSLIRTYEKRPDLLEKAKLDNNDIVFLKNYLQKN